LQSIKYKRIEAYFKTTFNAYSCCKTEIHYTKQIADIADTEYLYTANESTIVEDPGAWTDLFYGFQDNRVINDIPEDTRYINKKLLPRYKEVKNYKCKSVIDTAILEY
jgi:hypothetical protein